MIDAPEFPDVESVLVDALRAAGVTSVSNVTPASIPDPFVSVTAQAGGIARDWFDAGVNVGVNVYAGTEMACRILARDVQNTLATVSNGAISHVRVSAGGGLAIPRQTPPYQRYFTATVWLRAQAALPPTP